jgi:Protein of unknown function (DUF4239)
VTALPIGLTGVLFVVVLPALAVVAQLLIRRAWPTLADGEHNDVAGFIIAVVGVIYAVLLAFVVIVSWEDFSEAESTVGQEASALRSIYRESQAFPPDVREHLRADVLRYARLRSTWTGPRWPKASRVARRCTGCSTTCPRAWPNCPRTPPCNRRTSAPRPTGSTSWSASGANGSTTSRRACPACCGSPSAWAPSSPSASP